MNRNNPNRLLFDLITSAMLGDVKKCQSNCQCHSRKDERVNLNDILAQAKEQMRNVTSSESYKSAVDQASKFGEKITEKFRQNPINSDSPFSDFFNSELSFPYSITMEDKEDSQVISLVIPGISRDKVKIDSESAHDDLNLLVFIEKDGIKYQSPSLPLSSNADLDGLSAKLDLGILTVTVPFKKVEKRSFDIS